MKDSKSKYCTITTTLIFAASFGSSAIAEQDRNTPIKSDEEFFECLIEAGKTDAVTNESFISCLTSRASFCYSVPNYDSCVRDLALVSRGISFGIRFVVGGSDLDSEYVAGLARCEKLDSDQERLHCPLIIEGDYLARRLTDVSSNRLEVEQ